MGNTYHAKTIRTYTNGWSFEPATLDDIPAMLEIEKLYFETKIAFTEDQLKAWIEFNPNMFYVVKKDNHVEAFTAIAPITEECYGKLQDGLLNDMKYFKSEDFASDRSLKYCYFADIATRSKNDKNTCLPTDSLLIFVGIVSILLDKNKKNGASYVATTPVTNEGVTGAKLFGFKINGKDNPQKEINCFVNVDLVRENAMAVIDFMNRMLIKRGITEIEHIQGLEKR